MGRRGDWQIVAADGYGLAGIPFDPENGRPGQDAANARLFAAAPDLMTSLIGLVVGVMGPMSELAGLVLKAKLAIVKAGGSAELYWPGVDLTYNQKDPHVKATVQALDFLKDRMKSLAVNNQATSKRTRNLSNLNDPMPAIKRWAKGKKK